MHRPLLIIVVFLVAILTYACAQGTNAPQAATAPTQAQVANVRLPMAYIPNVQFAPFYAAQDFGYFSAENIAIEFDYSFETDGIALVGANNLQFTMASGEQVLLARAQGLPVVYAMAYYHDYPVGVVSFPDQNIKTPADLKGKKIGLPGLFGANYIGLRALMKVGGVSEADITLDSIGYNQVEALIAGQDQAVVIYANNEPIQLAAQGYTVDLMKVADYVQLASNGLVTNEKTLAENPDLVRRMTRAILKGMNYVIQNRDKAYEICTKYIPGLTESDERVQREILRATIDYWKAQQMGYSDPQAWQNMHDLLLEMGLLQSALPLDQAFTNQFITP
ncbi:MAG: ABC transporter substrate-binding protein [Anaerolineales bacterium]